MSHTPRDVPSEPEEFEQFKQQCRKEGTEWSEHLINFLHRLPYEGRLMTTRYLLEQEMPRLLDGKPVAVYFDPRFSSYSNPVGLSAPVELEKYVHQRREIEERPVAE